MPETESLLFKEFSLIAQSLSSKEAISFKQGIGYKNLTYGQILEESLKLGNYLKSIGIKPQDKVAIYLENQPEYSLSFFAIMYVGAVAVFFDIQFGPPQLKHLLLHSESKVLILSQKNFEKVKDHYTDVELIAIDSQDFQKKLNTYSSENRFEANSSGNTLACLFYTSGTMDLPKAVMLSQANLLANVKSIQLLNIVSQEDVVISLLPLHHTYSFTVTLLTPLLGGARIVYPPGLSSQELMSCLKETNISIFVGVPLLYSLMHRGIKEKLKALPLLKRVLVNFLGQVFYLLRKITPINLSKHLFSQVHKAYGARLRYMVSGGAKLDEDVAVDFFKWGFTILEGYGLTETAPVVNFSPPKRPKIGSVGKSLPNVEVKIIQPDENGIGEVAIKGPNVMLGYYHMSQQTKEVIRDQWFYSGDLGFLDQEGYLFLKGRRKEIIVLSSGKKINPEEVEKYYAQCHFIKELAVLASKQAGYLEEVEQLVSVIVIDENYFREKNVANIRDKLKWELENLSAHLLPYQRITGFVISKENLPRTRLGKIMRHRLVDLYAKLLESAKIQQAPKALREDQLLYTDLAQTVISHLKRTLKREVNIKDHLELDLGLDSLNRVELLLGIQERLQLKLSDQDSMDFYLSNTVEDLISKLKKFIPQLVQPAIQDNALIWEKILKEDPLPETLKKIRLKFGGWNIFVNLVIIGTFKLIFGVLFLIRSEGRKNLPKKGPYLLCPNHTNYLDGFFVLCALPFNILINTYFVGYSAFFEHFLIKRFIRIARLIPLEVSLNLVEALKACAYVLRASKIVCYFPQGQRSLEKEVKDFKKGVGILVKELDVPVIPIYIEGALRCWPRGQRFPRLLPIKVKFGSQVTLNDLITGTSTPEDIYNMIAKNLEKEVSRLQTTVKNSNNVKC